LRSLLLVALGGALGSMARFKLSGWVLQQASGWRFPVGTLAVNLMGCFIAGLLAGMAVKQEVFSAEARVFLFTGLLGGFTTFSAFGLETLLLMKRGETGVAFANVAVSVLVGMLVAWLGYELTARSA
jgi:CrcB protein